MVNIIKCVFILVAGLIMARYLKCLFKHKDI
jgi:hypothetical protein